MQSTNKTSLLVKSEHQIRLTAKNIAIMLLDIMQEHIGFNNAISKDMLFKAIFKRLPEKNLSDWLRWEFIKRAMHWCRLNTKCFIGSRRYNDRYYFFVIASMVDANYYIQNLEVSIAKMRYMQQKAHKAALEKWHLLDWKQNLKGLK